MIIFACLFRVLVALLPGAALRWLLCGLFPSKTVVHEHGPYLSRWVVRERADGGAFVIHYFHRSDYEAELHSHPWDGEGVIVAWGYDDELRCQVDLPDGRTVYYIKDRSFPFGARTRITSDTYHRTRLRRPDKGAWTFFSMGPRGEEWKFWDKEKDTYEPWQEAVKRRRLVPPVMTQPWWRRAA